LSQNERKGGGGNALISSIPVERFGKKRSAFHEKGKRRLEILSSSQKYKKEER